MRIWYASDTRMRIRGRGPLAPLRFELLCPTKKLVLGILGHMLGDEIQKKENLPYGWETNWKWATMVAKIRPVRVTRGDADVARDLRVS